MKSLAGKRILILEDEVLIALEAESALSDLGVVVVSAYRLKDALELARSEPLDAAVLDVNINGERSDAVEEALKSRKIPFVRATGYGGADTGRDGVPVVDKPYDGRKLEAALRQALTSRN